MIWLMTRHARWRLEQRARNRRHAGRKGYIPMTEIAIARRLEELRVEQRAERMSYGELAELQSLADHIQPGDVELLEAAGVPEFESDGDLQDAPGGRAWGA